MLTAHPLKHADSAAPTPAPPVSAMVAAKQTASDSEATTEAIQRKYAPLFERARQASQAHLMNGDYRGVVRESIWMCRLDDALVDDICALTGTSALQAQPFRNIRRSDIELLHEAARQGGNAAACAKAATACGSCSRTRWRPRDAASSRSRASGTTRSAD